MAGPAKKRQKREEYRKAQEAAQINSASNGVQGNDGSSRKKIALPKKKFYRQRAHANPFSDHNLVYPSDPADMDWSTHYPAFFPPSTQPTEPAEPVDVHDVNDDNDTKTPSKPRQGPAPEIADIGCGFGGLLVALSPRFPDKLILGLELRTQVLDYVHSRVFALRSQHEHDHQPPPHPPPPPYSNISALRTNTMKTLPNYFPRSSLSAIFLAFPDPHFKARKHKARIVSPTLVAEYAYVLKPGLGRMYTVTDVEELHRWICWSFAEGDGGGHGQGHGRGRKKYRVWERVGDEEVERDECVRLMVTETEEGKKVERNGGRKYVGVWRRREDPEWPDDDDDDHEEEDDDGSIKMEVEGNEK